MKYGVWVIRTDAFGPSGSWLKVDGQVWKTTKQEATKRATELKKKARQSRGRVTYIAKSFESMGE